MTLRNVMEKTTTILCFCLLLSSIAAWGAALPSAKTTEQQILEEKQAREEAVGMEQQTIAEDQQVAIEDTTPRFSIHSIELSGNTLVSTESLFSNIPDMYNAAQNVTATAGAGLYDFRGLRSVIESGQTQQVSARTIQGFTQYLLWKYQKQGYAGIYVYVPATAFEPGQELSQGRLPIHITEAGIASVTSQYFTVNNEPAEKGYLRNSALLDWSPVKEGEPVNRKKLDDYLNLMNLNPDRYVSAAVSRGEEPNSLEIRYNVYEANPWHFFVQVDNSGTEDIEWTPRFGVINTNLLGYDDKFTAVYQAVPDSTWNEEYAVFGSYDFPILGPRLRLNLFAGYNEFDIGDAALVNFLGRGLFAGGMVRYNLHQFDDWFVDVTGSLSYEESKISTLIEDLFNIDNNIHMFLGGYGLEVYRTTDMKDTAFSVNYIKLLDGSDEQNFTESRGAEDDFSLYTTRARHSQYLDTDKVQRVSGAFTWITTNDRLVPAKMTTFGGMYTVRGYDESEIIADEGILSSLQYEYDLVRSGQVELFGSETDEDTRKPFLRKLAPLAFVDYGLARVQDPTADEDGDLELASVGGGVITELGDNFMGTVYYGYPLIATDDTREGKGRLNVGILVRW